MAATLPKISFPVPSDKNGHDFSSAEQLLSALNGERSGLYLVGSEGMWHGGIHITDATVPWCALSGGTAAEQAYLNNRTPYEGGQFIRCMADGKIVAWRVCKDYESTAIAWLDENLYMSTSFVLVEHIIQPGENASSGLRFHTLYMNMAPFCAYVTEDGANVYKVAQPQRYYASAEDVQATHPAGSLLSDTAVTLSDSMITRTSDRRQFSQVTLTAETKNARRETLAAGTTVWTVSDRGSLKTDSSAVPRPSWWSACSPAYGAQSGDAVICTARTGLEYYLSGDDVRQQKSTGVLAAGFPLTYEPDSLAKQMSGPVTPARMRGVAGMGTFSIDISQTPPAPENTFNPLAPDGPVNQFSLVTLGRDVDRLKQGDRVWVMSDDNNLTVAEGDQPKFGKVVIPGAPIAIKAGDGIGHMGFYQLPEESGKESRYQVHIECLSMDDKLPAFLSNPDGVGADSPAYLNYPEGATLFAKNGEGKMEDSGRKTRAPGRLTLSGVPVLKESEEATYYQIRPEGGWLAAANVNRVAQWSLGERGFVTLDRKPESFDLIDGVNPPDNVVKGILAQLHKAAQADPRTGSALNRYNYERLLKQIDSNKDGYYSEEEYLRAVQVPAYRDHLYRIIAKHPSEWWYNSEDALWKTYLDPLKREAPEWKHYLETFIGRLTWMKAVPGMGPDPWHMHPVVFLEALVPDDEGVSAFTGKTITN